MPSAPRLTLRPYAPADAGAVLSLVNADRLPGQPVATPEMLHEALAGRSPIDGGRWAELDPPATHVAAGPDGTVRGVVSWTLRPKDGRGLILWLHCRENPRAADALLLRALTALGPRPVEAFQLATALTRGLEALPRAHREATHAALERAGFHGEPQWRYLLIGLPAPDLPRAARVRTAPEPGDSHARRLEVRRGEAAAEAEAVIGLPVEGAGALWWIGVRPPSRRRGLGRALLGSALDALASHGAREAFLYVETDTVPGAEDDRTAATALYRSAGFREVDTLHSYARPPVS
ncbi:GNAT family N-acetyltransferase [Streptomyces katrae]|uniref:GNAT family N-acetyltransferase n=1 Tax=Streptomyces katrae TaxID=68223 RepID=A0ABT7H4H5_9ACTN|nr:GNAT family N-acetyltransferase [Streptomyces katrae]MDK9500503.1 GNAT family N-acetyltransferase [Streptomyces katrae]